MRVTIPAAPPRLPWRPLKAQDFCGIERPCVASGCRPSVAVRDLVPHSLPRPGRQPHRARLTALKETALGWYAISPARRGAASRVLRDPRFGAPRDHPRPTVPFTLSATANPRRSTCDGAAAGALETTRPWRVLHCVTAQREASFAWVSQSPSAARHARRRGNGPSPEQRKDH